MNPIDNLLWTSFDAQNPFVPSNPDAELCLSLYMAGYALWRVNDGTAVTPYPDNVILTLLATYWTGVAALTHRTAD